VLAVAPVSLAVRPREEAHLGEEVADVAQQFEFDLRETEGRAHQGYTLHGLATGYGRFKRTSGMCHDAAISLILEPYSGPTNFLLEWLVTEQQICSGFIPSVIKGVRDAALFGRDECRPIIGVRIGVVDGFEHEIYSQDYSFQKAAEIAFQVALTEAELVAV
jgi:hypothetical protein